MFRYAPTTEEKWNIGGLTRTGLSQALSPMSGPTEKINLRDQLRDLDRELGVI
jgi:hypothetical protein